MAEKRKKKPAGKGSKPKKGGARPFYFSAAAALLTVFVIAILVLTLVHHARTQRWFSAPGEGSQVAVPADSSAPAEHGQKKKPHPGASTTTQHQDKTVAGAKKSAAAPRHAEEYQDVPRRTPLPLPSASAASTPRLAIIVDDLGGDEAFAAELFSLDLEVTAAVLPNLPHARRVAQLAHQAGREVMVHIPMEPLDYPAADPGRSPLFVNLPAQEIRRRMESYLQAVPYAVGGNNHMGSRFTADREGMGIVLTVLRQRGLYFIDSRTAPETVAFAEARAAGVPTAERDVFLDNDLQLAAITAELRTLVQVARERGGAVGICHPHAETLVALRQMLPQLAREGVKVVPASELVR